MNINVSLGTTNVSLTTNNTHWNIVSMGSSFHPSSLEKVVTFLVNYKGKNCSIGKQARENNKVKVKVGTYL